MNKTDPMWVFENYGAAAELIDELELELEAARKQEPAAYVLFRDGEVCYEADDSIVISNTPGDETDLYKWLPVFTLPPLAGQVRKRDASRAAIEKLRAMSHDELLAEVEALLATPSMEV